MVEYCLGFFLDYKMDNLLLIKKQKPEWQKGLWNGVGGHINRYLKDDKTGEKIIVPDDESFFRIPKGRFPQEYSSIQETPLQAMQREFQEEASINVAEWRWHCFQVIQYAAGKAGWLGNARVYCFAAFGDEVKNFKLWESCREEDATTDKEVVRRFDLLDFNFSQANKFVYNVPALIAFIRAEVKAGSFLALNPNGLNYG